MSGRALLLAPSRGLGGGIERYVETLEWAFTARGVEYQRFDLCGPGPAAHVRMLARVRAQLRGTQAATRLVVAHRALLPVASLLTREQPVSGVSVVCHGTDVWAARPRPRWHVERHLMRRPGVRVVAVSSFTAGVLSPSIPATILVPGLSLAWFHTLVEEAAITPVREPGINLTTAFRLADWREKGLPQLLDAVAALGRTDIRVTICGHGEPPADLRRLVRDAPYCALRPGLTDRELARELAAADLFILATRTTYGRNASGEGFGLVLLEAQVAGTPVIGPAHGGSRDAFIDGVTGVAPADETTAALTKVLGELLADPQRLARMGKWAAEWARECFAPESYAERVVAALL